MSLALIVTLAGICLSPAASLVYDAVKDCAQAPLGIFRDCAIHVGTPAFWKYVLAAVLILICVVLSYCGVPMVRKAFLNSHAYKRPDSLNL